MRTLNFIVDGQKIRKDPSCNFSGIAPGSRGYLAARFRVSSEWTGRVLAASFWRLGKEYPVMLKHNTCIIPDEALTWDTFDVSLTGVNPHDNSVITTAKVTVVQEG